MLVEVVPVGVCGTDSEIKAGRFGKAPPASDYLIIGHEGLGKVAEVGRLMRDISVGDQVVASVRRPCPHGHCRPCRNGANDFCTTGDYRLRPSPRACRRWEWAAISEAPSVSLHTTAAQWA